uniref:Uncharacterized protein n=1 Tax=Rhizophora mucronata TaxID=61149 RepID=A0A2P2PSB9_RHIMU
MNESSYAWIDLNFTLKSCIICTLSNRAAN